MKWMDVELSEIVYIGELDERAYYKPEALSADGASPSRKRVASFAARSSLVSVVLKICTETDGGAGDDSRRQCK